MGKTLDFVYYCAHCPSDGCPEYFFNHKMSFNDERGAMAFAQAKQIIERYESSKALFSPSASKLSALKTKEEISDFVSKMLAQVPNSYDIMTIFSCKHGSILYQKAIRFNDIQETDLAEKIKNILPPDFEAKLMPLKNYFVEVK